ncbi:neuroligin-2-like isoform X2 [Oratosquilla oratoria]|uniref:neuroligin-2-like isoform X2 n=1 Tax=Oratosquilla oratoria TaxID=337810 RepID=UPI003F773970
MDQIAALHWLKENIAEFGGDPDNVTLFGHGTGASCINFLMTSKAVPRKPKLFHRGILLSGSSLAPWSVINDPLKYTRQLARALNCSDTQLGDPLKTCLREKPLHLLMQAQVEVPEYYYAFGPTVDGVVIDTDFDTDRQAYIGRLASYDLMFGVTPADAFLSFNDADVRFGLEPDKRNKILRTFIRNTYNYHLTEIMATVINEYTEWDKPVRHPISTRDETLQLLSDALYAAPVTQTATFHAASSSRATYAYVFDHQTRNGDYEHRVGCIHGAELAYVWGAPLVDSLTHFPNNFTSMEVKLAETTITYFTNFARSGNPNEPMLSENEHRSDRNKQKNIEWPPYDHLHKKYLSIGLKVRVKDHYRSHQLSFWLELVPQLHRAGKDAPEEHHHLENHDDWSLYRGNVRSEPVTRVILPPETTTPPPMPPSGTPQYNVSAVHQSTPSSALGGHNASGYQHTNPSLTDGFAAYSTALSVTIAIGCSLLILNVLIFAGVYYQRDKSRMEAKKVAENGALLTQAHSISGDIHSPAAPAAAIKADVVASTGIGGGLKAPPPTPMSQTTHLPPPEFADYPSQPATYVVTAHSTSHLHTLPRSGSTGRIIQQHSQQVVQQAAQQVAQQALQQQQHGGPGNSLTLTVPRAPPPPRVPTCHVSDSQSSAPQQTSFTISSPHSPCVSKTPPKDSATGELRV